MQFDFKSAYNRLKNVVNRTPLQKNISLSKKYGAEVYLKREDLQIVRSYKLRGAYNMIADLTEEQMKHGVVCASAGNHAQGFAYSCNKLGIKGVVFMPKISPKQKIKQTKMFGENYVTVILEGDTFDDCAIAAKKYAKEHQMTFIPPFDNPKIIEGQATVAMEILEDLKGIDYIFVPIGGGGLAAGVSAYFKENSPETKIIGVEPKGAQSMKAAFETGAPVTLDKIDSFVDGAAVKRVGDLNYEVCKDILSGVTPVDEGKICSTILSLYSVDAIVVEPAGAMSVAVLDQYADEIKGKTVVCILSGGNNDIDRMQEMKERSLQYEGLKHYFLIRFAQRPGALKDFVTKVLGPNDDIIRFEYMKKNHKENGPALVGIELNSAKDYEDILQRLKNLHFDFKVLNEDDTLFSYIV